MTWIHHIIFNRKSVDVPQVEMRPLSLHSSVSRGSGGATFSGASSSHLRSHAPNGSMGTGSSVRSGSSTATSTTSSPLKYDRRLEEVNLQLEDEFQEEDFLMRRNNCALTQVIILCLCYSIQTRDSVTTHQGHHVYIEWLAVLNVCHNSICKGCGYKAVIKHKKNIKD